MEQKERIEKMEKILSNSSKLLEELEAILDKLEKDSKNYDELIKYYYSNNWVKDKEDFEKDLISDVESAHVLTEDGIYDMMTSSSGTAIHMLELATKILKRYKKYIFFVELIYIKWYIYIYQTKILIQL